MIKKSSARVDLFALYQEAVQTPLEHTTLFQLVYADIFGKQAKVLREDFSGTFLIAQNWITFGGPERQALALDLDSSALDYGKKRIVKSMTPEQRKRLTILKQDVRSVTSPKADIVAGCNFSFFIFHERKELLRYFRACFQSLSKQGALILEMSGGPGMITKGKESRTVHPESLRMKKFRYVWDQKTFDPITRRGKYAIHFELANGQKIRDAFEYDWRLWTIPEIRDVMVEAGFDQTCVYWECADRKGQGTGEYARMESGDNAYAWIAYVVGQKGK